MREGLAVKRLSYRVFYRVHHEEEPKDFFHDGMSFACFEYILKEFLS